MEVDSSSSFFKKHAHTHTSLATIIALVIEKEIEENKRKLAKEIYTFIDRDPLTRKKESICRY